MVFFAGLPGTGKSLLTHQLAHLARSKGRDVQLLQWDLARPVFEASPAGQRYPLLDGVTHVVIRRAVGLWARDDIARRHSKDSMNGALLVGETPLVGNRLVELVTPADDDAEAALSSESCAFALPVPSDMVRRHVEDERRRRFGTPLHQRELEDASPEVMAGAWRELVAIGKALGIVAERAPDDLPYDADVYRLVYERLLQHRHVQVIALDTLLPTASMSVYDYPEGCEFILPQKDEVEGWTARAEREPIEKAHTA
jgi:hypothetical protein